MSRAQVGDVVQVGRGKTLWTVHDRGGPHTCGPRDDERTAHSWTLVSQVSGYVRRLVELDDEPEVTLIWSLEEIVFGADAMTTA